MPNITNIAGLSKADAKAINTFRTAATKARNMSGELLVRFAKYLPDGNVVPLNALLTAILEVRSFHADSFVKFVLFHTGGMTTLGDGVAEYHPERSALSYNAAECKFAIKSCSLNREEREACPDKESQKAAKAAKVEAQRKILELAASRMGLGAWWELAPEKPKSPYKPAALWAALKRAKDNYREFDDAVEAEVLRQILAIAEENGIFDK